MSTVKRLFTSAVAASLLVLTFSAPALPQESINEDCYPVPPEGCVEGQIEDKDEGDVLGENTEKDSNLGAPDVTQVESGDLAATGVDSGLLALGAAGALAAGGGAVAATRRRSRN